MSNIGRMLWRMAAGIWLGTLVFFSLVVTRVVFVTVPMPAAGHFLTSIFPAYYAIGIWAGLAALAGGIVRLWGGRSRVLGGVWVLTFLAWALVIWARYILSVMNHLTPSSIAFTRLHAESIILNTVVGILLIGGFVIEAWT